MSWDTPGFSFERRVRWPAADIARFARDLGDANPLHHDAEFAQPVAILIAMCGSQATRDNPGVGLEFNSRLLAPARVDEEIVFRWRV